MIRSRTVVTALKQAGLARNEKEDRGLDSV